MATATGKLTRTHQLSGKLTYVKRRTATCELVSVIGVNQGVKLRFGEL